MEIIIAVALTTWYVLTGFSVISIGNQLGKLNYSDKSGKFLCLFFWPAFLIGDLFI